MTLRSRLQPTLLRYCVPCTTKIDSRDVCRLGRLPSNIHSTNIYRIPRAHFIWCSIRAPVPRSSVDLFFASGSIRPFRRPRGRLAEQRWLATLARGHLMNELSRCLAQRPHCFVRGSCLHRAVRGGTLGPTASASRGSSVEEPPATAAPNAYLHN